MVMTFAAVLCSGLRPGMPDKTDTILISVGSERLVENQVYEPVSSLRAQLQEFLFIATSCTDNGGSR